MLPPKMGGMLLSELLDGEKNSAPIESSEKLAPLVKGALYVSLVSDSYKVLLKLFPGMLRNSSGNDLLSWLVMSIH